MAEHRTASRPELRVQRDFGPNRFAEAERAGDVGGTLRRILTYFTKQRALIVAMLAVVLFSTFCGVLAPGLQSDAIDIVAGMRAGRLGATLALMFVLYLMYSAGQFLQDYFSARLSQQVVKRMREELFGRLADIPVRYLDQHSHGDVMSRMTNDIESVSTTISQSLPSLFSGVLMIVGTVAMMLWYCWQLTLLSLLTVGITVLVTKLLSGRMRAYSRERQRLLGLLNGTVEELVSGYRTVVAYNRQDASTEEFRRTSDALTQAGVRVNCLGGVIGPITNSVGNLSFVVIAAFGGWFAIRGIISIGVISAFIVYSKQFSRPLNQLAQIYAQLQSAIAGAERVFTVLDEAEEDMSGDALAPAEQMTVRFEHVRFSYTPGQTVLRDFSLTVPNGKKVALVGATGSGKTTVVNLLMRFYDVEGGAVFINEQDIAGVSRAELRRSVAIVLQDTVLFADTVRNNLKYGNGDATDEEILRSAAMSRCKSVIDALPEGLDTVLSGGVSLSQGQRQLLSIARAFLADPKILILDEATSSVDTRTEKAIQDAMQTLMRDRTSIVIAHRLSTIRDADLIVVMDEGRIAERGSHAELLARGGKYAELYMTQYAGVET